MRYLNGPDRTSEKFEIIFWPYLKKLFEIENNECVILKKLIKIMIVKQLEKKVYKRDNA